jgi:hypothetical protein
MSRTTGMVAIRATALEPLHHGAGTSGNTQLLRMQRMINPETGKPYRVPFVSGNSMKHRIRYHAVQYALDVLGVEDQRFTKAEVDLLFSGGHLNKSGGAINLAKARRLEELFPALSMCGYSAGNTMTESKLRVSHLHLVCEENSWRLPEDLREVALSRVRAGALRGEEFGTRHDMAGRAVATRLLTASEAQRLADAATKKLPKKGDKSTKDSSTKGDSAQMIYDFQVVNPGAQFWGSVWFNELSEMELAALSSSFHYGSAGADGGNSLMHIGAKSSVGFGLMSVELRGAVRAQAVEYRESKLLAADGDAHKSRDRLYCEHLRDNRDAIFDAIRDIL